MDTANLDPATLSWSEIKQIVAATSLQMRETDRRMQETNRMMRETDRRMQETDKKMQETDQKMKETDRKMKETDRRMKELQGLFTTQWGKLIEALSRPVALKLFKDKGIQINQVYKGAHFGKYETGAMEVDVILCNTTEAVAVEVKTTCKVSDVDYFMQQMTHFKDCFHPFEKCKVFPAIAALQYDEESDIYALKHGLFVLHANGDGIFSLTEPKSRRTL